MRTQISCIYEIVNIKNNERYIGSAKDFNRRRRNHLNLLKKNKHHSNKLQNNYNKYGECNFNFYIIEELLDPINLITREQYYLDLIKPKLNMTLIAGLNSSQGLKRSKETCKKISEALKGKGLSEYHKKSVSDTLTGKKQSNETKQKRSDEIKKFHRNKDEPILQYSKDGSFIKKWKNPKEITDFFGDQRTHRLYDVLNETPNRKTYKNFKWIWKKI
jgi:group I intron endonuclease